MSTSRERFEAAAHALGWLLSGFERGEGDGYDVVVVNDMWEIWQACERQTAERCVEIAERLDAFGVPAQVIDRIEEEFNLKP